MDNDLEAIGTNAHELPMVLAALAPNEEALKAAPYQVLQDWQSYYGGNLLIVLPDAFGTDCLPARCARLGGRLDRLPPRQRAADRGRREDHRLVAARRAATRARSC